MDKHTISYFLLLSLVASVVTGMLYFGFRFKGFRPANNVRWAQDGRGLSFGRYGIAYTEPIDVSPVTASGLSIEIALQTEQIGGGIHFVLLAHNGDDAQQLLLGQWRSKLIVMHGDDYENSRRSPKITVDIGLSQAEPILISIVSGESGTQFYLNGELKKENPTLKLRWPGAGSNARLILGNSAYGHHSWRGTISGLAVYPHVLSKRQVDRHYRMWRENSAFDFAKPEAPALLVALDENAGERARDQSGNGYDLIVPAYMRILKKEVLMPPWHMRGWQWDYKKDALLNFIGFWPLGFLMAALLNRSRRIRKHYGPAALMTCFVFSLSIELGQAWIPSRTSSLLDLILNTTGAGVGVLLYAARRKFIARKFFRTG